MTQPTYSDVYNAMKNWVSVYPRMFTPFEKFIGYRMERIHYLIHEGRCDADLCRKIELLNGPHYRAVIKAWEAKQDALSKQEG